MLSTDFYQIQKNSKNQSFFQSIVVGFGLLVAIIDLYAVSVDNRNLELMSKPLIMPLVTLYFLITLQEIKTLASKRVIIKVITAFVFSWLGDVLLLFSDTSFNYFLLGILCFLVTQVTYIFLFNELTTEKLVLKKLSLYIVPFLLYLIAFYGLLWKELDFVLRIAVFVYAIALTSMGVFALSRIGRSDQKSFLLILIGGGLFIFSDSAIAYSRFIDSFQEAGFVIMFTYIVAQVFIMLGIKTFLLRFTSE